MLFRSEYHPYFQHVARAAQKKAKELAQYGVQVNFYPVGKSRELSFSRGSAYWHMLRELDGIVTLGLDTPEIRAYMGEARRLEIPVVFYNTYVAAQEFLAYVGCDYEQSADWRQVLPSLSVVWKPECAFIRRAVRR